jgi:DNA-binding CsgD family transcriptional regulator
MLGSAAATRGETATAQLLERDAEIALLDRALERAADGQSGLIVIEGDAGLGKSSLLTQACGLAQARGFTSLTARGGVLERTFGWGVARQLLEETVVRASAADQEAMLRGSAVLAMPVLGLARQDDSTDRAVRDFHFEHGLYWLACNLAERGPLALVIDDVHWCDDATLSWLLYLFRRAATLPLAAIIAMRPGESGAPSELLDLLAAEPLAERVALAPLGLQATGALLRNAYGADVEPAFQAACHEWTGGNPLFVSELAGELVVERVAPVGASAERMRALMPTGAARTVLLRIARLSGNAQRLARASAVLESDVDRRHAMALAELGAREAEAAFDELVAANVLMPALEMRFVHPLISGIIYADTPAAIRASMHERAARLLEEERADPGRVAAHLLRCSPAGNPSVVAQLRAAAARELERGSPSTAVTLLERARSEPPAAREMVPVLFALGRAEALTGDPAGEQTLREALAASVDELERGMIALHLGRLLVIAGEPSAAAEVARGGAEAVGWRDPELRLQLEALLVNVARSRADLIPLIPERLALVRDRASDATFGGRLIAAQLSWGMVAVCGSAARAVDLARRGLAGGASLAEAASSPDEFVGAIHMLTFCDELEQADQLFAQLIGIAQASGSEPAFAGASCFRSYNALLRGDLGRAELLARDALRTASELPGLVLLRELASAYLVLALVERGAIDEASKIAPDDPLDLEDAEVSWATEILFASGRLALRAGDAPAGLEALLACGRRTQRWGVVNPAWLPWRSEAALALHALGDVAEARRLCDEELDLARRFGARRPIGIALRVGGLIEGGTEGIQMLRESAAILAESPARLDRGWTLVELGCALRRGNQRAEARELLSEGFSVAERAGAVPLADRARAELAAAGARPRSVIRTGVDSLTASERRVCELAAAGKSNPEIAQMLFVTRATVESHLHSAYRRLEISSRRELAAALATET